MANKTVKRWVATKIGTGNMKGLRVLCLPAQGRFTFLTRNLAQSWIDAVRESQNNTEENLWLILGDDPSTAEPREVECWEGHFDPVRTVFDL